MKFFALILIPLFFVTCKNGKKATATEPLGKKMASVEITEGCPGKKGTCKFEVMPGQSYHIETDGTGMMRPVMEKNAETMVIKFTYSRGQKEKQIDGQYREEVYAIIPAGKSKFEAVDKELKDITFLYGRFCYCQKNSVGYVKVDNGRLKIENGQMRFQFKNGKIPQIIDEVAGKS